MNDSFEVGEKFAHSLMHAKERKYDPVKRKEYYERTKKLKGRNPSKAETSFRSGERTTSAKVKAKAPAIAAANKKLQSLNKTIGSLQEALIKLSNGDQTAYKLVASLNQKLRMQRLNVEGELLELNREISGAKRLDKMSEKEYNDWKNKQ